MQQFAETKELVLAALLAALGIVLNIAEGMIPLALPFAGAKIGLANIAVLLCLYLLPLKLAVSAFCLRILLSAVLLGTFLSSTFLIGGAGGVISFLVMLGARKFSNVSLLGVSIAGAAAHNLGQVLMASFIINNLALLYYLPIVLLLSIPAGLFTGYVANTGLALLSEERKIKKPA